MIITKSVETQCNQSHCDGCGCESTIFTYIGKPNPTDDDKKGLFLCPICKSALEEELILRPNPCRFSHVKIVLKREIDILKADVKSLGDQWKKEYGLPFTKDRLKKHKNEPLTIGIFKTADSINECERIMELIRYDE